jgi:hypothetical protein
MGRHFRWLCQCRVSDAPPLHLLLFLRISNSGNGHGTHCAGTASGTRYGVAKAASLIAVKVLSDQGSGAVSDIVSGLNWVMQQVKSSGRPSIVSMSLGGGASTALDQAVAKVRDRLLLPPCSPLTSPLLAHPSQHPCHCRCWKLRTGRKQYKPSTCTLCEHYRCHQHCRSVCVLL